MTSFPWSAYDGRNCVAVGTVEADDARGAIEKVLGGQASGFAPRPDRWYSVRCAGHVASGQGAELGAVAAAAGRPDNHTVGADADRAVEDARRAAREAMVKALGGADAVRARLDDAIDGVRPCVVKESADKWNPDVVLGGYYPDPDVVMPIVKREAKCSSCGRVSAFPLRSGHDHVRWICTGCQTEQVTDLSSQPLWLKTEDRTCDGCGRVTRYPAGQRGPLPCHSCHADMARQDRKVPFNLGRIGPRAMDMIFRRAQDIASQHGASLASGASCRAMIHADTGIVTVEYQVARQGGSTWGSGSRSPSRSLGCWDERPQLPVRRHAGVRRVAVPEKRSLEPLGAAAR